MPRFARSRRCVDPPHVTVKNSRRIGRSANTGRRHPLPVSQCVPRRSPARARTLAACKFTLGAWGVRIARQHRKGRVQSQIVGDARNGRPNLPPRLTPPADLSVANTTTGSPLRPLRRVPSPPIHRVARPENEPTPGQAGPTKKGTGLRLPLSRGPSLPSWLSPDRNHLVDPGPPRSTQEALSLDPPMNWVV